MMMSSARADPVELRALRMSQGFEFNRLIEKLLTDRRLDDDALSVVRERMNSGEEVFNYNLVKMVAQTGDGFFYDHIPSLKSLGVDDILILYRCGYPDPEIEKVLLDLIYKFADKDDQPSRRYIAEAMRDVGSTNCLEVLTRIRAELERRVVVGKGFIDTLDPIERIKMSASISFYELIDEAVEAVRERGFQMSDNAKQMNDGVASTPTLPERAYQRLDQAKKYQSEDPTISLNRLRIGAEAIAHTICQVLNIKNGKAGKKLLLSDYIQSIRSDNRRVPDLLLKLLEAIQAFGNSGSHDEGDEIYLVNEQIAGAAIILYENLIEICEDWLPTQGS